MNSATADPNATNPPETQSAVRWSDLLGRVPRRRERRLEILKLLVNKTEPVSPKDVGAEVSDQTSADLQRLEKYGMVKSSKHPYHPYFRLYEITENGRKVVAP
jgi:DNA-binding PadR family transcriptional regulator